MCSGGGLLGRIFWTNKLKCVECLFQLKDKSQTRPCCRPLASHYNCLKFEVCVGKKNKIIYNSSVFSLYLKRACIYISVQKLSMKNLRDDKQLLIMTGVMFFITFINISRTHTNVISSMPVTQSRCGEALALRLFSSSINMDTMATMVLKETEGCTGSAQPALGTVSFHCAWRRSHPANNDSWFYALIKNR